MRGKKIVFGSLGLGVIATLFVLFINKYSFPIFQPRGTIATGQYNLLIFAIILSMFVVLPVLILTFYIAYKYRESNESATYAPDFSENKTAETIWWGIPIVIVTILSVFIWSSSHSLDPFKPLVSDKPAINVQVVALQWKWLFIYPDYNIASTNMVKFPVDTPVHFQITADAPMNSFWIPSLGGQIYAMAGMQTSLFLDSHTVGSYRGSSANISGTGFSEMKFAAEATTQEDFDNWVSEVKNSDVMLDSQEYLKIAQPNILSKDPIYSNVETRLFENVIMQYSHSGHTNKSIFEESY